MYMWADGIYLKAGLGTAKACLMVLIGADTAGLKHLIALREGYRESTARWDDLIGDCRSAGVGCARPTCARRCRCRRSPVRLASRWRKQGQARMPSENLHRC